MNQDGLEGRLLAHRRLLQLVIGALAGTPAGERILTLIRDRATLQDGQEDPVAVERRARYRTRRRRSGAAAPRPRRRPGPGPSPP